MHRFLSFCLLLLIAITTLHAETFRNPYRISTASDPTSVIVADLNSDGLPDIVYGDSFASPATLHVLLAQPGAPFVAAPTITLPANSGTGCHALDTNRDGKQDIVCVSRQTSSAFLATFLGVGDGTFSTPTFTPLSPSADNLEAPIIVPLADVNSDGLPDLMVLNLQYGKTYIMLSNGDGRFTLGSEMDAPPNTPPSLPAIALDVNGDGKPDLLFAQGPYVRLGNGDGTFGPNQSYSHGLNSVCIYADMDGDSHVDAVCGYVEMKNDNDIGATHLIILHGNPDGSFNPTPISDKVFGSYTKSTDGQGTFEYPVAIADLNGDGIPDVIASCGYGLSVMLGQSALNFSYPTHYVTGLLENLGLAIYEGGTLRYGYGDFTLKIADLNRDGHTDIVTIGTNGIYINYGRSDGSFDTASAYEVAHTLKHSEIADFNGDGIPDIAATGDSSIELSLGNGDGTFASYQPLPNGGINFMQPVFGTTPNSFHGDFNGDGKQDLLVPVLLSSSQYSLYLYFGHGDGTFAPPLNTTAAAIPQNLYGQVVDIDGDGRDDLLSSDSGGTTLPTYPNIYVSLSNGDGTFRSITSKMPFDADGTTTAPNCAPALADFNHDGKLDAVFGSTYNAHVVMGHGDGSFDSTGTMLPFRIAASARSSVRKPSLQGTLTVMGIRISLSCNSSFPPRQTTTPTALPMRLPSLSTMARATAPSQLPLPQASSPINTMGSWPPTSMATERPISF